MEAYKIGVTVAMTNLISVELISIINQMVRVETQVGRLHMSFAKLGAIGATLGLAEMFKDGVDEARKFQNEITRFSAMGFGDAATAQAVKLAKSMDIAGLSYAENMKIITEATGISNDPATGATLSPIVGKAVSALSAFIGDGGTEKAMHMVRDLIKISEMRGNVGPGRATEVGKDIDAAIQAYIASGGTVSPSDFYQFIKTGGAAAKGLGREAFFFQEYHGMQETGGLRAGTGLMSSFQNLVLGRASHQSVQQLLDMGLLDDSKVSYDKIGKVKGVKPGALIDTLVFMNSQFDWFEKNVAPQLPKNLNEHDVRDKLQGILTLAGMQSNRTAINRMVGFYLEEDNFKRAVARAHQADAAGGLYDREGEKYQQNINDFTAKWKDLLIELGTNVLPVATKALAGFTWFVQHVVTPLFDSDAVKAKIDKARSEPMTGFERFWMKWFNNVELGSAAGVANAMARGSGLGENWSGNAVPPPQARGQAGQAGDVYLDGEKVGKHVVDSIVRKSNVPNAGPSFFDSRMSYFPAGAGFSR